MQGEPPTDANAPTGAVFLSYASEDVAAAERIATALRDAGIEAWFDQSELRGGDAWDRRIREQIHNCRLFVALISANTEGRDEGYFRREWKLAVDRTHDMDERKAFLVPLVIDGTSERGAHVPEKFRELQWTRLPRGEASPDFVERVRRLLSIRAAPAQAGAQLAGGPSAAPVERALSSGTFLGRRKLYSVIAAAVFVALGYLGFERLKGSGAPSLDTASIAVLPLTNESGEASQQYFSDGISEDLITALSQFPKLKVIGRTSAFQFRNSKEDSRSIGAKLGVAHLIEGSVRREGEMVRVSAELIDTADGSTQWSERYDRPYKDLFALQDEITRAVAEALRAKLLPGQHAAAQSDQPPSGNLEAYNALLQGRFYYPRGTEADFRKAIELFTQATGLDPRYAVAWAELSRGWTFLSGNFLEGAAAQAANSKAREAADRALSLSPDLAAAHNARGDVLQLIDFDWRGAEAEYRRALELSPNDADTKLNLASQLAAYGKLDQAIALSRQALVTEPLRAGGYKALATYLLGLQRLDEALQSMNKAVELRPTSGGYHSWLTIIQVQRGDAAAALEAAQQAPAGVYRDMSLAYALQIGSDRSAADAALRTFIERDAGNSAFQIAEVYALRNDAKATFEWLDRAWINRDSGIPYLLYSNFILRYKADPRFAAFCREVGLPAPGETPPGKST